MKTRFLYFILVSILAFSCTKSPPSANQVIDRTVTAYGGDKVFNSVIEFDFRDKHYYAKYHNKRFSLKRVFTDSSGHIIDELTNDGFTRHRNDSLLLLDEEWTGKYTRSVNSVIYFFRIPFVLKDSAVIPTYLGEVDIKGQSYYKLGVKFSEEGGGEDFDDSFIYWVNKENNFIDFLAYSYSTDGGGKRFREAIHPREVNGLRIVDYINYEPENLEIPIENYESYFEAGGLKELSKIENRNVSIEYLN